MGEGPVAGLEALGPEGREAPVGLVLVAVQLVGQLEQRARVARLPAARRCSTAQARFTAVGRVARSISPVLPRSSPRRAASAIA